MKIQHKTSLLMLLSLALCLSCSKGSKESGNYSEYYNGLPFKMEKIASPSIPARSVSLSDFNAVGDGVALNTEAFAKAIEDLAAKGGGHLNVPAGIWRTGPIALKDNIDLHLEANATLVFDPNPDLYPIISTNFEGLDMRRCTSPISAVGVKNISITGEGTIDGSGDAWRELKKQNAPPKIWKVQIGKGGVLNEKGDKWFPDEGYAKARETSGNFNNPDASLDENEIKRFLRPVLISIKECENVLLQGVTFQNSPAWNLHPLWSKNIIIDGVKVRNTAWSTNGDGIDIDACENVLLVNSTFDVGDDAICIKSGKDADGRAHGIACKNLIIDNCTVYSGHGGFVVGSEMSGGVENIKVSNCSFLGTDVGLRFKSTRGRGGVVKDIWIDNIYMKDIITNAVIFNLYYGGKSVSEQKAEGGMAVEETAPPVDETTPSFRDIHVSNVVCNGADAAIFINGLPEMPVSGMDFKDCVFSASEGIEIHHARDISFENVKVHSENGAEPITSDVQNLSIK